MRSQSRKTKITQNRTFAQILASGRLSRREHLYLTSILLAGQHMTETDRLQINQVLDFVQLGKLELSD